MTGSSPLGSAVLAPALKAQAAPSFEACRRGLGLLPSLLIQRPEASSLQPEVKRQAAAPSAQVCGKPHSTMNEDSK